MISKIFSEARIGIIVILCSLILTIAAPYIFTLNCFGICFNSSSGVIGDTIGGITAPIIGAAGAILVYLALRSQIAANKKIQLQIEEERINRKIEKVYYLYNNLQNYLDNYSYGAGGRHEGILKIFQFSASIFKDYPRDKDIRDYSDGNQAGLEVIYIMNQFKVLFSKMENMEKLTEEMHPLAVLSYDLWSLRFKSGYDRHKENPSSACPNCKRFHDPYPCEIGNGIEDIEKRAKAILPEFKS